MPGTDPFVIEELSGPKRRVTLTGHALPAAPFEVGGRHRTAKTTYQGSTVASKQMFGPDENDTEVSGFWHSLRMDGETSTVLEGFRGVLRGDLVFGPTAEECRDALDAIRRTGQLLQVSWSGLVRVGTLDEASFPHHRSTDIEWRLRFSWVSQGEQQPAVALRVALDAPRRRDNVLGLLARLRGITRQIRDVGAAPIRFAFGVRSAIDGFMRDIDATVETLVNALAAVSTLTRIPNVVAFRITTTALNAATSCRSMIRYIRASSINLGIDTDSETGRASGHLIVRDSSRAAQDLETELRRLALLFSDRIRPLPLSVVVGRDGEDVRELSRRFYGTPDLWQRIADRNGLESSRLRGGEVLIIPERS